MPFLALCSHPFLWLSIGLLTRMAVATPSVEDEASSDSMRHNVVDAHGAIIRGDISRKEIALVFTGHEFAEGGPTILETLKRHGVPASFFLTGTFYANNSFHQLIRDLKEEGHFLGAHSDEHLLYADWSKRDSLLVTEERFKADLRGNYQRMEAFGIRVAEAQYFLPPYEWYNATIVRWTGEMGLTLVNFSPGTRSTADYTYPQMSNRYVSSDLIYQSIIEYKQKDPNGLNGFILLMHIGTDPRRTDKFYNKLDRLINELKEEGYKFARIDDLLTNE